MRAVVLVQDRRKDSAAQGTELPVKMGLTAPGVGGNRSCLLL